MKPSRADRTLIGASLLAVLGGGGCGLDDGNPWGLVSVEVGAAFEAGASRLDETGRVKTANDYRIVIDAFEVELGGADLLGQSDGASAFDPAAPPEGYSLCHNGHCHADDGRLVSYEDIAAELAGGGGAEAVLTVGGATLQVVPSVSARAMAQTTCTEATPCEILAPTTAGLAKALVTKVRVQGRVFDGRTGEPRVSAEGEVFDLVVTPTELEVGLVGEWAFGPGERLGLAMAMVVKLPPSLFDGVAWDTMDEAARANALGENLVEGAELEAEARRFD